MTDHYKTLGLDRDASAQDAKKAYWRRARETHPDLHPNDPNAREQFEAARRAVSVLADPVRRAKYDETGDDTSQPDNARAQILNTLSDAFNQALTQAGDRFEMVDLLAGMRAILDAQIRNGVTANVSIQQQNLKLAKISGRLSFRGDGDNFLARKLGDDMATNSRLIAQNEKLIADYQAAKEMAADYVYAVDAPPPVAYPPNYNFASSSTTRGTGW